MIITLDLLAKEFFCTIFFFTETNFAYKFA